jgi:hypothetical protein
VQATKINFAAGSRTPWKIYMSLVLLSAYAYKYSVPSEVYIFKRRIKMQSNIQHDTHAEPSAACITQQTRELREEEEKSRVQILVEEAECAQYFTLLAFQAD